MRAYLRLDPGFFQRKVVEDRYPIPAAMALVACLCLAETQPQRGRFASEKLLRLLLDEPESEVKTRLGRHVRYLIDHGDLVKERNGTLYVDGWDEWQEGDVTVKERMARVRGKRAATRESGTQPAEPDTAPTVTDGTPPTATEDTDGTPPSDTAPTVTPPSSGRRYAVGGRHERTTDEKTSKGLSQRARDPDAADIPVQTNGRVVDPDDRAARIARARRTLADPKASRSLREAAIAQLGQLGAPLEPDPDDLDFGQAAPA